MRCGVLLFAIAAATAMPLLAHAGPAREIGGRVVEVAWDSFYLDRGAADGLTAGSRIIVLAGGGPIGAIVSRNADHYAAAGPERVSAEPSDAVPIHPGDRWTATVPNPEIENAPPESVSTRAGPHAAQAASVDSSALATAWVAARSGPAPLHVYRPDIAQSGYSRGAVHRRGRVTPAVIAWPYKAGKSRTYAGGILTLAGSGALTREGALRGRMDLDMRDWAARPNGDRLRPASDFALLLRALALDIDSPTRGIRMSIGRARPPAAPGVPLLDGAAFSWKRGSGAAREPSPVEIGVYGGVLPDPLTLRPASDRVSLGTFVGVADEFGPGVALSARGRLSVVRAKGVSQPGAQLALALAGREGLAFDAGAAGVHPPGTTRWTDGWAGLRRRSGTSEMFVRYRRTEPVLDPLQAARYEEVLGTESTSPGRTQGADLGYSGNVRAWPLGRARADLRAGRFTGSGDLARWTADGRLTNPFHFGPLRSWKLGYRGSSGWQEGHEGEVGCVLYVGSWQMDVTASGGAIHQSPADRTSPIVRGLLGIRRFIGVDRSVDFFAAGQGGDGSFGGTTRLAFSWSFQGSRR